MQAIATTENVQLSLPNADLAFLRTISKKMGWSLKLQRKSGIDKDIRLPKYLADGVYTLDISLYEPNRQVFLKTPNCQTIHIEGFYDQYAHPINLSRDGFIGLESLLIKKH